MSSDAVVVEVYELTRELGIGGMIRLEMIAEPDRAVAVLRHATTAPRIRNRGGFATANWKGGFDPRPGPAALAESELADEEPGPPALETLEHCWSRPESPLATILLRAMAAAIGKAGGFNAIKHSFYYPPDHDK